MTPQLAAGGPPHRPRPPRPAPLPRLSEDGREIARLARRMRVGMNNTVPPGTRPEIVVTALTTVLGHTALFYTQHGSKALRDRLAASLCSQITEALSSVPELPLH